MNPEAIEYKTSMEKALSDCDRAMEVSPGHQKALRRKGLLLSELGRITEAKELLRRLDAKDREVRLILDK